VKLPVKNGTTQDTPEIYRFVSETYPMHFNDIYPSDGKNACFMPATLSMGIHSRVDILINTNVSDRYLPYHSHRKKKYYPIP
jgi:hypothetical protein